MQDNELLLMKEDAQKRLADAARHDLSVYFDNLRKIAQEVQTKYGIIFKYGTPQELEKERLAA